MQTKIRKFHILIGLFLVACLFILSVSPAFAASKKSATSAQSNHPSIISYEQKVQSSLQRAAAHAPAALRAKLVKAIPMGNCNYSLVTIWYNNGSNAFCVDRAGYNGLDFALSHVTAIGYPGGACVGSQSWLLAYYGSSSKSYVYFNGNGIYNGPNPPYNTVTQVDVQYLC